MYECIAYMIITYSIFSRTPAYLERTDPYVLPNTDKLESGLTADYGCKDLKVLMMDANCTENCATGYSIECFNGEYIQNTEWPAEEDCVEGKACDLELFKGILHIKTFHKALLK